ncbi:MAG: glycosyltransferase [Planctomycetota bacterium]
MVHLNRIYTKQGDGGTTQLGDGSQLPKHHARVSAYGTTDELSSLIGLALVEGIDPASRDGGWLRTIQNDLFDCGSDLCVPGEAGERLRITAAYAERLEGWIDEVNAGLEPLNSFVLPGGTRAAAHLQRRWWGMCRRIVCCSDFLRGILVDSYGVPGDKAVTVLNAYHGPKPEDVRETRAEARAALGLGADTRYALTICRLMVWKRVDQIVRSVAEVDGLELLVAGDGDMLEEWRRLSVELGVEDRVHFLGNVPHGRIPSYIRAADVFVLNSEYEGLSHTLLEVQALGTPMVASGVCGNPEVVEDGVTGLLVDPRDHTTLTRALERVLGNPEEAQGFVQAALERAPRFDRDATFGRVEALLRGAAGPRASSS